MFISILPFLTDPSELGWMGTSLHGFPGHRKLTFGGDCFAAEGPSRNGVLGNSVAGDKGAVLMRCLAGCG